MKWFCFCRSCFEYGQAEISPATGGEGGSTLPMAFAPPKNPDGSKLRLRLSSWTPLNHQLMNDKVFEERRSLLGKWFDKWTDGQRRRILVDLLERCSLSQQKFCAKQLQARVPTEAVDFTTRLPRVLSLYIFSFLDPRSLCRCAQEEEGRRAHPGPEQAGGREEEERRSWIHSAPEVIPLCRSRARPKATSPSQLGQTSPKRGPAPQGAGPELPLERRDPPGTRPSAKTTAQRSWRCHQGGQQVPVTSSV
ncbi:F-box only protein 16 isoform X7 [Vidua chalybeata]|uniref:F-box only protein 16 isoform X7 n=1 Tax=Vidua chalybeata TaxID=81927 RepID=UPI0023A84CC8|nr:F-box only protein 16 isoform X7 [Vidua chalybeata]